MISFRNAHGKQETLPVSASVPPLGLSNKAASDSQSAPASKSRDSTTIILIGVFFSSSPCLDVGLRVAKAVRGRARFHHVVAGGRKSIWPRIRGDSVSLCPSVRPDIDYFLDLSSPSLLASPRLASCSQRRVKPQPRSTQQSGSTRRKPSDRSASHSRATRSP